jgi:hypothetical protein
MTAARAKGYDLAFVAVLESVEDLVAYLAHPAHAELVRCSFCQDGANLIRTHALGQTFVEDLIAFDLEF